MIHSLDVASSGSEISGFYCAIIRKNVIPFVGNLDADRTSSKRGYVLLWLASEYGWNRQPPPESHTSHFDAHLPAWINAVLESDSFFHPAHSFVGGRHLLQTV
jgi:hypothetical protein